MRIVLYQPDIPQNTGTILRLSACLGISVEVIGPTGFDMTDRALRRAGLDYLSSVRITRHESFAQFDAWRRSQGHRLVLLSTHATTSHVEHKFHADDLLLLGRESAGVPADIHEVADARVAIPMQEGMRSLNIAVAASMVLGEALRQTDGFPPLSPSRSLPNVTA